MVIKNRQADSLTIFFPAYNEEAYIQRAVDAAIEVGDSMVQNGEILSYEIVIIDDASTDKTAGISDRLAANNDNIRCVHHETNKGLGGSVRTGLTSARGSIVLYSDIDLPFDMMELRRAYRLMRYYEADIVSAFRFDRTSEGLRRLIYSEIYNGIIKLFFRLRIKDVNFAFKLFRKEVIDAVSLSSEGSFIDAELLAKADRSGYRIIQFGTNYFHRSRGVSTLSSWTVIFKIIREMLSLYKEIKATGPPAAHDKDPHR